MPNVSQKDRQQYDGKRPFFSIWTGLALSLAGSRVVQFALIWWLTKQSGSAIVLTMASLEKIRVTSEMLNFEITSYATD